ncbi:GntR family transcriptional regulator [Mangrovibacillus cuniculi]|uniref:GntR family transcriptional regulator n=1 Tax=Mangrovibacillus cuniculi TaxID=2593652 RepID=A0A7S8CCS6_9BACI|nr:GntR family transcriptional regulator [Mangrovibacillus cuniculi]QPC47611.1 GntR family transcriptional regulator [Mangrovibacillus cuniculi]
MQFDESKPIFQQVYDYIVEIILREDLSEESQVPSTTQFATNFQINPATAGKGINQLVDQGILYKKRGVGMFVAPGAVELLKQQRKEKFYQDYVEPLVVEASRLGINKEQLVQLVKEGAWKNEG